MRLSRGKYTFKLIQISGRVLIVDRLAWFYLISALVGGFASLLAYGLVQMEGLAGVRGWQWIFVCILPRERLRKLADVRHQIIEGIMTCVAAIVAYFVLVDFPDKAHQKGLLSHDESEFIKQRLDRDRGDAVPDALTWAKLATHLADFKVWVFALMFMSTTMPAYALAYFGPVIILGMGYTAGVANALGAPPIVFAVFIALVVSWCADRYHKRWPALVFNCVIGITGLMMTAYSKNDMVRYGGLFLGQAGCQGNIPTILAYQSNNIRMQSKRAVGSALQIGFGAIGGILGSTVFFESESPTYPTGLWITAGLQMFILTACACMSAYFRWMNGKVDKGTLKAPIEGQPGFKFTL